MVENACVLLEMSGSEPRFVLSNRYLIYLRWLSFTKKCDFIADLAPQESSVNCAKILSNGIIATGGMV